MRVLYPGGIGICSVSFCGGRKTGEPREKPSEQGRELTTLVGGERSHHPCSPKLNHLKKY